MNKITEKEHNVWSSIGKIKFPMVMVGIYNNLCPTCRLKVLRVAKRGKRDYLRYLCVSCTAMTKEKLEPYTEGEQDEETKQR